MKSITHGMEPMDVDVDSDVDADADADADDDTSPAWPLRPMSTPKLEQEAIDHEVAQLEDRVIQLKRRRNALALVARLPPEILLGVFHLVRGPARMPIGGTLTWIRRLTHICSAWRVLALGDASLWTDLCFDTPMMLFEMIRRAGAEKPLTLSYDYNDVLSKRADQDTVLYNITLPFALHQIHRLQHLKLVVTQLDQRPAEGTLQQMPDIGAPLLRSFSLTGPTDDAPKLSLPPVFFRGWTRLETLELRNCNVHWDALVQFGRVNPNLQRLVMHECSMPAEYLEDFFQNMTQLRHLELHKVLSTYRGHPSRAPGPTLSFNHLQTLRLYCYSHAWQHFVKSIGSINPSVRLHITIKCVLSTDPDLLADLAPLLAQIWGNRSPSPSLSTPSRPPTDSPHHHHHHPTPDSVSARPLLGIVLDRWPHNEAAHYSRSAFRLELHHTLFDIQNSTPACPCTVVVTLAPRRPATAAAVVGGAIGAAGAAATAATAVAEKAAYAWRALEHLDLAAVEHLYVHMPMHAALWVQASRRMPRLDAVQYIVDDVQALVCALQEEWVPCQGVGGGLSDVGAGVGMGAGTGADAVRYPTVLTQVNSFDLGIEARRLGKEQLEALVSYFEMRHRMGRRCEEFMIWPELPGYSRQLRNRLAQFIDVVDGEFEGDEMG